MNKQQLGVMIGALAMVITMVACGSGKKFSGRGGQNAADDESDYDGGVAPLDPNGEIANKKPAPNQPPAEPTLDMNQVGYDLGYRNLDQIRETFLTLTGVTMESATGTGVETGKTVATVFDEVRNQLLSTNSLESVTPAVIAATTKFAAYVCDAMIRTPGLLTQKVPGIDLTQPITSVNTMDLSQKFMNAFWPVGLDSVGDINEQAQVLSATLNEIKSATTATGTEGTQSLVMSGCAAVLASSQLTIF